MSEFFAGLTVGILIGCGLAYAMAWRFYRNADRMFARLREEIAKLKTDFERYNP